MKKALPEKPARKNQPALKDWARALSAKVGYDCLCLYEMRPRPVPALPCRFEFHCSGKCRCNFDRLFRQAFLRVNGSWSKPQLLNGQVFTTADLLSLMPRSTNDTMMALRTFGLSLFQHSVRSIFLLAFFSNPTRILGLLVLRREFKVHRDFSDREKRAVKKKLPGLVKILQEQEVRLLRNSPGEWLIEYFRLSGLSPREVEVARLALEGFQIKEMAGRLCVDLVTVRDHLKHIYFKLGVASRPALMAVILRRFGILAKKSKPASST